MCLYELLTRTKYVQYKKKSYFYIGIEELII